MKIIAFGASTSSTSINKKLATYAGSFLENQIVEILDLNDFDVPLFSEDKEKEIGSPSNAKAFKEKLNEAEAFIISMAEHNGSFTASFKNLYDWVSRIDQDIFGEKKILLLSTSPGPNGASSVLGLAKQCFPFAKAVIAAEFSLPSFYDHFADGKIVNEELSAKLQEQVKIFEGSL